ncbi:MAG: hypothetical protein A3C30_01760 [Candidatus Levybacteria bacterium RIFCSPHIGHO2_02_FULL_40_18]|nr:MAG: hypothetical protein A2869_00710 [Candidatus Levybacteria bacterium RIFCSPHIGHO2_01_FULL_40_58]OGH26718.1 MAG: hypothetical protein A3C30_01760 [Candidatus Levybacteria bacterium RIFCSPHIGHO2_02_FULL_40_18]OGH31653.1 MAG: hypothetical protein A3E43_01480 [Candidatus Levybacteria bacterium RIFCSPHIGHO2_12_FULL_40_31]OGH40553.1 MAG: hypothetical protein A2894_00030 [Candidatus Levybacteria bacterium RIFCSPLOWO2_01_FULL_40_64]OGH48729.1 MAG: hypothetical protein A3I54_03655 [Candidatus Lev
MKQIISRNIILATIVISFFYYISIMALINKELVLSIIFSQFSLVNKLELFSIILFGFVGVNNINFLLLVSVAILTGANLTLLFQRFKYLIRHKIGLFSGGSFLTGVIGSGCVVVCSTIPFIIASSFTGASIFLPLFENLKYISVVLLSLSLYFLLKNYKEACMIEERR